MFVCLFIEYGFHHKIDIQVANKQKYKYIVVVVTFHYKDLNGKQNANEYIQLP